MLLYKKIKSKWLLMFTRTDNLPQTISASMGGSETLFCVRVRRFRTLPRSDIEGVPRRRDNGVRPTEIDSFENHQICKFPDPRVFVRMREMIACVLARGKENVSFVF